MSSLLMRRALAVVITGIAVSFVGCGPSPEFVAGSEKRLEELKGMGVPDSALAGIKVHLYATKDAMQRQDAAQARRSADSLKIVLRSVDDYYTNHVAKLQPVIDSLVRTADAQRAQLQGVQLQRLDSIKMAIDSLSTKASRPVEAEKEALKLVALMPQLMQDEARSAELRKNIPGSVWECVNKKTSDVYKEVNAVEKKVFTFGRDGKAVYVESEKGQSDQNSKRDYEFVSYGTYDFAGDTIVVHVNRFVSKRQTVDVRWVDPETKKITWKKELGPTYDSLITDRSQDRYIVMEDLKADFKKR